MEARYSYTESNNSQGFLFLRFLRFLRGFLRFLRFLRRLPRHIWTENIREIHKLIDVNISTFWFYGIRMVINFPDQVIENPQFFLFILTIINLINMHNRIRKVNNRTGKWRIVGFDFINKIFISNAQITVIAVQNHLVFLLVKSVNFAEKAIHG